MVKLKRSIGQKTLLLLAVNAIMDTGIFFTPAIGAALAGPASVISWIAIGVVSIVMVFCFAEFISMYPKAGGIYEYTKRSFSEFPSFIVGWIAWIVANITIAMVVAGSINYIFPQIDLYIKILIAVSLILLFNYINYRGINYSTKLLIFFGIATILTPLVLMFPGAFQFDIQNFMPFFVMPHVGILLAIYFISDTFFGWESVTYLAEEVKNARKVLPKVMVLSTFIVIVISIVFIVISLGASNWSVFGEQRAPLSYLASVFFGSDFARIFSLFVVIPMIGTVAGWVVSSPRLLFAMSRDKVLPKSFSDIHNKNRTPHKAILFQTIVTIFVTLVGFADYVMLLSLVVPLAIIMYSVFLVSFIKMRISKPHIKRHYKAPFGIAAPFAVIVFFVCLLGTWLVSSKEAVSMFGLNIFFIIFGVPLYLIIKLQTDKSFVSRFYNTISFSWDYTFPLWYGKNEISNVMKNARIKSSHKVLDFGCGTGITTFHAAQRAKNGLIVAVDISDRQIERAFRRIKKKINHPNVIFVKEDELDFEKNSFDTITAVGVLEHLPNPQKTVENLMYYLKPDGTFSFLSFGKSFTIPAPTFLKNKKAVLELFKNTKTHVKVRKETKKFTDYWYIYGRKKKSF